MNKILLSACMSGIIILGACNTEETIPLEKYSELEEKYDEIENEYELLENKNSNLERDITYLEKQEGERQEGLVGNEEEEGKTKEEEEAEEEKAKKKEEKKEASKKEREKKREEQKKEEVEIEDKATTEDLEEEIESILEDRRTMEAKVSQGEEGNYIVLEGRAKDSLKDSGIGRRVKEDMAKILIAFKEKEIDFEEVRISFYLPTVNAYGEESQSNMALGVFDKETVDRLNEDNEYYIAESIDSIALEFELDSKFTD